MRNFLFFIFLLPTVLCAQFGNMEDKPLHWDVPIDGSVLSRQMIKSDPSEIARLESLEHASYISSTAIPTSFHFSDFQLVEVLPNGDKVYRLLIHSPYALGMMMYFEDFYLEAGAKLWLYDLAKKNRIGAYSQRDNYDAERKFMTSVVRGSEIVVEYLEPKNSSTPNFTISRVYHYFRGLKSIEGFGGASSCMINVNCSEGSGYGSASDATCRILVSGPSFSGWCTGTLLNNTSEDLTPYVLTANHCSQQSTLSGLKNWEFHFFYQSSTCASPAKEPSSVGFKGASFSANSGTDYGDYSSDFLLLKLTATLPTNLYDFTFLGWDRRDITSSNNVCFQHPQGDIKKVSHANNSTIITGYSSSFLKTHWKVFWSPTTNGHSVTEGGSSGSGLLNSSGLLVGTLTGGGSSCTDKFQPDFFGRLYMHWDKYGSGDSERVDKWLDPSSSGLTTLRTFKTSGATNSIRSNFDREHVFTVKKINEGLRVLWDIPMYKINIYNLMGQQLFSRNVRTSEIDIDLSSFCRGIYVLEAVSDDRREVFKIEW